MGAESVMWDLERSEASNRRRSASSTKAVQHSWQTMCCVTRVKWKRGSDDGSGGWRGGGSHIIQLFSLMDCFTCERLFKRKKSKCPPVFNKRLRLSFLPWHWWLCVKAFWRSTGMWDCSDITRSREKCVNTRLHRQNKKKPCCQATSCAFVSRPPASGPARTREVSAIAAAKAFLVSELDRTRGFSPWKMCFFRSSPSLSWLTHGSSNHSTFVRPFTKRFLRWFCGYKPFDRLLNAQTLEKMHIYCICSTCFYVLTPWTDLSQARRLCAHPFLEIYREGLIQFMAPLARQGDFYVPEIRQAERRLLEREDFHSDSEGSGTCGGPFSSLYKRTHFFGTWTVWVSKPCYTIQVII